MDLTPYINRLVAQTTSFQQIFQAQRPDARRPVDSEKIIRGIIHPVVTNGAFLLSLPPNHPNPNAVYQMVSSQDILENGFTLGITDTFLIYLRAADPVGLVATGNAVINALGGDLRGFELSDQLTDYDDMQQVFRYNMEVPFTYLPTVDQSVPALILFPVGEIPEQGRPADDELDGCTSQLLRRMFGVAIIHNSTQDIAPLREEVKAALIGFQVRQEDGSVIFQEGEPLDSPKNNAIWVDVYRDNYFVSDN